MSMIGTFTRLVLALAVAAMGVVAAVALSAAPASADGPDTPPAVKQRIEALPWPVLQEGDDRWEVMAVEFLMVEYGHLDITEVDTVFDARLTKAVRSYQTAEDLSENGTVGPETWEHVRADFGVIGESRHTALKTKTVQLALNQYGNDLTLDGKYGPKTKEAVIAYQKKVGVDADGWVGPITFRALICGGV